MLKLILLKVLEYFCFAAMVAILTFAIIDQERASVWESLMTLAIALVLTYVWLESIARQSIKKF